MPLRTYGDWFAVHVDAKGGIFADDNHGGMFKFMFKADKDKDTYYVGHNYGISELVNIDFDKQTLFMEPKLINFKFVNKGLPLTKEVQTEMYFYQKGSHKPTMKTKWHFKDNKMYITFLEDNNTWTQYLDVDAMKHSQKLMQKICRQKDYGTFTTLDRA